MKAEKCTEEPLAFKRGTSSVSVYKCVCVGMEYVAMCELHDYLCLEGCELHDYLPLRVIVSL